MPYYYTTDDDGNEVVRYRDDESGDSRRVQSGEQGLTQWQEEQGIYSPDSIYERAITGPDGQQYVPAFNTTRGGVQFTKDMEAVRKGLEPYAGSVPGSQNLITGPDGNVYMLRSAADQIGKMSQQGGGFIKQFLNGPGAVLLPAAIATGGTLAAAYGAGGTAAGSAFPAAVSEGFLPAAGAETVGGASASQLAGATIGTAPHITGSFLPVTATAETAGVAGATGAYTANQAALFQMAIDAGMTPAAAEAFVASGGTMGSIAAGGGGVGVGAVTGAGVGAGAGATVAPVVDYSTRASILQRALLNPGSIATSLATSLIPRNADGSIDYAAAALKYGPTAASIIASGIAAKKINSVDLDTGPNLAIADEDRKAGLRKQVNTLFDSDYSADEKRATDAIRGRYSDELKDLYDESNRNLKFSLARSGQVGGSLQADKLSDLEKQNRLGSGRIEDAVQNSLANIRNERELSRGRALSLVEAGTGEEAVRSGQAAIKGGIDLATSQQRQALFSDMFNDAAYTNALRNNQDASAFGANRYLSQRTGLSPSRLSIGNTPGVNNQRY